jgi:hypothetical protein
MCPACGSHELKALSEQKSHQLTLGGEFHYMEQMYKCASCGEEGDFANRNDDVFKIAEHEALKKLVPSLIDDLSKEKISMAQFERAFELPQRTLTRWKGGDFSASSVALLRTIKTFPFIINVAEKKFNPGFAQRSLFLEAFKLFGNVVQSQQGSIQVTLSASSDGASVRTDAYIPRAGSVTPTLRAV